MPLLPSTQTKTANGVPLYVPMDGEGNALVPNKLTVLNAETVSSVGSLGTVTLGGDSGVSVPPLGSGRGVIQGGNVINGALNDLVLNPVGGCTQVPKLALPFNILRPLDPAGTYTEMFNTVPAEAGIIPGGPEQVYKSYILISGRHNTGANGGHTVELPTGRTGFLIGGSATCFTVDAGGQPYAGLATGTNTAIVYAYSGTTGNPIAGANVFYWLIFGMTN